MRDVRFLAGLIARFSPDDGIHATCLPRIRLIRSARPTLPMPAIYAPSLCIVAQGEKEAQIGRQRFRYDPASFLLAAVDLPVMGAVTNASGSAPYLCLALDIDRAALAGLIATQSAQVQDMPPAMGLMVGQSTPELLDAACRLVTLLDTPEDAPVLAPLIECEILWRLLSGPAGPLLRHMASGDTRLSRVDQAIIWLRRHFADPISIDRLADMAGMSPSSFHEHFRAVTGLSPLRYRARIRLQEARRLMLSDGLEAADAGFQVGYNSPSQFSREYSQEFGLPPARDIARLRVSAGPVVA